MTFMIDGTKRVLWLKVYELSNGIEFITTLMGGWGGGGGRH